MKSARLFAIISVRPPQALASIFPSPINLNCPILPVKNGKPLAEECIFYYHLYNHPLELKEILVIADTIFP
jgi:hypothetical protein